MSTLLAISGPHVGRRFTLKELTRLGRAPDNDIILTGNLVSRYHAEIERNGPVCIVADLGSKNGIYVNDNREVERRLKRGDRLKIGETIRAVAEVKGTDPEKRIVTVQTDCFNQDGEPVVKGEAVILLDPLS